MLLGVSAPEIRVECFSTMGTYAMAELGVRMGMDIPFNLIPGAFIITDIFTMGANRQDAS